MHKKTEEKQCTSQKWQRRKDARPGEIVAAALELFVERGFSATKLDDVAKKAGISKGTLYLYFESKEALFRAVVRDVLLPELERAEAMIDSYTGDASALLRQLLTNWWKNFGETQLCGIPKLVISEAGNFPELAKFYVDEVILRARHLVAAVVQKGIDAGEFRQEDPNYLARLFFAPAIFSAIWKHSLMPYDSEKYVVEDVLALHLDIFIKGIRHDAD